MKLREVQTMHRVDPLRAVTPHANAPGRRSASSRYAVRSLHESDLRKVMLEVGPLVDSLYPMGAEKLLRRLEAVRDGYAYARLAIDRLSGAPVGLAAEVGKGDRARKLSTFWISPTHRRRGCGGLLLDDRIADWTRQSLACVHVTVRSSRAPALEQLFLPRGFQRKATESNRYGTGMDETTLLWSVDFLSAYQTAA